MGKILTALTFLVLLFLALGTYFFPTNPLFWLVSGSEETQVIRLLMGFLLITQLLTNPPRRLSLRLMTGLIALGVGIWAVIATYSYQMDILDTLAFLGSSIALGITALEVQPNKPVLQTGKFSYK
jgi:hypothetical protein